MFDTFNCLLRATQLLIKDSFTVNFPFINNGYPEVVQGLTVTPLTDTPAATNTFHSYVCKDGCDVLIEGAYYEGSQYCYSTVILTCKVGRFT